MQHGSKTCVFSLQFLIYIFIETLTPTKEPEDILAYLKEIKPGMMVSVASFDDVTPKKV